MPPMSRTLMTAWATVSNIVLTRLLSFHQRRAGVFLRKDAGQIAILPLYADRVAVNILAVGSELHFSARRHRRVTGGDIERGQCLANLLRVGGGRPLQRAGDHEGLRDQAAGIFEQEFAGALLVFDI